MSERHLYLRGDCGWPRAAAPTAVSARRLGKRNEKEMQAAASSSSTDGGSVWQGEVVTTIPTIGFNVETVNYKNIRFQVWDLGALGDGAR